MEVDTPVVVAGAGGFLGGHLVKALLDLGHNDVRGVDIKPFGDWWQRGAHSERQLDLSDPGGCKEAVDGRRVVFNLACDMGGMGFIEPNKALCARNVLINTNVIECARHEKVENYFFASSACVYPERLQNASARPLREEDAYPAECEAGYGWEKLFSEQVCQHYAHDYAMNVHIARFHTVFGPLGSWRGGREKVPAALCRKVAEAHNPIEVWGDGKQQRSMLYVDDAIDGVLRLMASDYHNPVNIGATEVHTVDGLLSTIETAAKCPMAARTYDVTKPQGVRGRTSDNTLMHSLTGWEPTTSLLAGIRPTYEWIAAQVA